MTDDCKVYVSCLSYDTTEGSLADHFGQIGEVAVATIMYERGTGRSKGFGFVTFVHPKDVDLAIAKLSDSDLDGRQIKVSKANSQTGGGGGGSYGGSYGGDSYGGGSYGGGSYGGNSHAGGCGRDRYAGSYGENDGGSWGY